MSVLTNGRPSNVTAHEIVEELILQARRGQIISVKETITVVRRDGPQVESDCAPVELIVEIAPAFGLFVAFDLHE
ncbi:hypothetical protein [Mesorhizobium sp. M0898]|uniref:hypothetical protein n=1 Tax=unclassified Mesorhizobium TaxID=325217 RepID=UPI00333BB2DC